MKKIINKIVFLLKDNKGAMIIEVSIAILIMSALFLGYVMYTNAMRYQLVMTMAAREGAREYMVTYKKYNDINKSKEDAVAKTIEELKLGGVNNAKVTIENKEVKIKKPLAFYIPIAKDYLINLKAGAEFHEEELLEYYDWN